MQYNISEVEFQRVNLVFFISFQSLKTVGKSLRSP